MINEVWDTACGGWYFDCYLIVWCVFEIYDCYLTIMIGEIGTRCVEMFGVGPIGVTDTLG